MTIPLICKEGEAVTYNGKYRVKFGHKKLECTTVKNIILCSLVSTQYQRMTPGKPTKYGKMAITELQNIHINV